MTERAALRASILALLADRGTGKTICPSEAARAVGRQLDCPWRPLMETTREVARELEAEGALRFYQHGEVVDSSRVKGPIRLGS